jgi:hypothetical protein
MMVIESSMRLMFSVSVSSLLSVPLYHIVSPLLTSL